jgi:hypothetical protein
MENLCEIRDFKTGQMKDEHHAQLHVYAVLWWRDIERNPATRPANRLVISYDAGDVEVEVPTLEQLALVEANLRKSTEAVLAELDRDPPNARPSVENCSYCSVRHLCEDYWHWRSTGAPRDATSGFSDLQIKLSSQHSDSSWGGVVESCGRLQAGEAVLLRTSKLPFELKSGLRLRILNAYVSITEKDLDQGTPEPVIATMGVASEAFLVLL